MEIPLNDYAWQHRQVRTEIQEAIDRILDDPYCDGLPFVKNVEAWFTNFLGNDVHAVTVQSGLAAEFLALKSMGIGPGDEVITVPNSDMATTGAISHTGARFVLVDIDPDTHNIDPNQIEAAISRRTKAIMPVHMYGLPAEMDPIREIARRHDLKVIEDATLSLGAEYCGARTGTLADVGFFSLATSKVVGGTSNGGVVTTADPTLARNVRLYRGYGLDPDRTDVPIHERNQFAGYDHVTEGYNLKLDSMQAAIAGVKLTRTEQWAVLRQAAADRYTEFFADSAEIETPIVPGHMRHAWRNYVIKVPRRDTVREHLRRNGIASNVLYTPPIHLQSAYRSLGLSRGSFPNTEKVADSLLCLPIHPGIGEGQVERVATEVTRALG